MIPASPTASSIGFSRYLGLPAAAAMGVAVGVGVAVFVDGFGILEISGNEAPLVYALAMVLFLPLILSHAERALEVPGSGTTYQLAAASGSPRQAFAAGWLLLGGAVPLAALLVQAVASRLDAGLERLFGIEVAELWLVVAVAAAAGVHALLAEPSRWRTRTVVVWGSVLVLVGILVWAFFHQPSGGGAVPERKPLDHWLSSVALLGAALWSLEPILHHRPQLRGGGRALPQAMLVAWITALGIAIAAAVLLLRQPGLLMEHWVARLSWSENRLELLTLAVAVILCLTALYWTISGAVRLIRAMVRDGFLPAWLGAARSSAGAPAGGLGLFLLAAALLATRPEVLPLAGAASLAVLWATVVVLTPRLRRRSRDLPAGRSLKLPLHPLFPLLAVASALFFSLILPSWSLRLGLGWSLLGVLYFLAYAHRGSIAVQQRELVVGEPGLRGRGGEASYRVLVWADDADATTSLIRLAGALARARAGELLVLRVVRLVEQLPLTELRDEAEDEWCRLDRLAGGAEKSGARIRTLVRIAPTPAAGVLETVTETRADFLLLGAASDTDAQETLERIFAASSRPLAVLHGNLPEGIGRVLVASAGGPHAPAALELGDALAGGATAGGATAGGATAGGATA
ncbi:MAG: amino acid permease, partial [Thermoanaerobaculia bacterium]